MKRILLTLALLVLVLIAYLGLWPLPVEPVSWNAPVTKGYAGAHAVNHKLAGLQLIQLGGEEGPEHVVLARDGKLYAAVAGGKILRMNPDGTGQEMFANTGGRVLGFDFDAAGNMIAADAIKGLLSIGLDRKVSVLADKVGGIPMRFADAIVVAGNGKVYFSDASARFGPAELGTPYEAATMDIIEQRATGRLLEYDPATKAVRIVANGLSFANGVALSRDEKSLFVAETGRYRVWKIAVTADNLNVATGSLKATVLLDNLPGFPDNLMRGMDGKIWLGFSGPRNADADALANKPFLRKLIVRLPRFLWPIPKSYGHVIAFTEDGQVVADMQDPTGAYPMTTGVTETADRIYVQNLHLKVLGWRPS